jgi:mannonate dehydratase
LLAAYAATACWLVSAFDLDAAQDPARAAEIYIARRDHRSVEDGSFVRGAHLLSGVQLEEDTLWENLRRFLAAAVPAAEEAGVRLALHPDDPPVPVLGGIARICRSVSALRRALDLMPSPAFGLDLCLGTVSEMGGEAAVLQAIAEFGPRGEIVYVHFRDVRGCVPRFAETFLGDGNFDPLRVMRALKRVGFSGFILDDHVPHLSGDTAYGHRGRAHAIGYLQALLSAVESETDNIT